MFRRLLAQDTRTLVPMCGLGELWLVRRGNRFPVTHKPFPYREHRQSTASALDVQVDAGQAVAIASATVGGRRPSRSQLGTRGAPGEERDCWMLFWGWMYLPKVVQKQPEINAAVVGVVTDLAPWVKYIRYDIGQDWSGQWAIFFRVLLSDDAARNRLRDVATRVVWRTSERLDLPSLGLFPYFDFRSESEQARLHEPSWEPARVQ